MIVLAAAATHSGINPSEAIALILAVAIAAFWKAFIKVGLALLVILIAGMVVGGAVAIMTVLHALLG